MIRLRQFLVRDQEGSDSSFLCEYEGTASGVFVARGLVDDTCVVCGHDTSQSWAFKVKKLSNRNRGRVRPGVVLVAWKDVFSA